ncbi:MAG: dTDP-4-dehydrorhamnose reductase [Methylococcaceae bacterium]
MKILITGGNGQVGWELSRALLPLGELIITQRNQADFSKPESLSELVETIKPDVIVNATAYTAVDKAETETELAQLINGDAVAVLAQSAKKVGALLVHYSTDYVFDGSKQGVYYENDTTNPLSSYGRSKLAGELAIQASGVDSLILRTTWVYAARGSNFVKTILRLAAEREELNIVADQFGAPTWAKLIAQTTAHIIKQSQQERKQGAFNSDIYNLTSTGETSWHGFAQAIIDTARSNNVELKNKLLNPIPTTAYPLPAQRPLNSRLSVTKLENKFDLVMPNWQTCLKLCMAEML